MFELYQTMEGSRGSLAEVWIDRDARLVRKNYKVDGITIRGSQPLYQTIDEIKSLVDNELYWSEKLKGSRVLEIYDHGDLETSPGFYILQEYVGPDLLYYYNKKVGLSKGIDDPVGQLVELFKLFRDKGVYKINNAMCNLVNDNGLIRAFDFKYAVHRTPDKREIEMYSIKTWLSKIDDRLPHMLEEYL